MSGKNMHCFYEKFYNKIYKDNQNIDGIKYVVHICDQFIQNIKNYGKYVLMKTFNFDINGIVSVPPIIDTKKYEETILSAPLIEHEEEFLHFVEVLEKRFSKDQLLMLRKNLRTMKFKIDSNSENEIGTNGYYAPYINKLYVKEEKYPKTLFHELFHAASSRTVNTDNICGFNYESQGLNIGFSLNEGYTEIMCNRYFDSDVKYSFYSRSMNYFNVLENVLGVEKLEDYYITGNLAGLVKDLSKFRTEKEVIKFIIDTDNILRNEKFFEWQYDKFKVEDTKNKIISTNLFLSSLLFKKNDLLDLTNGMKNSEDCKELYMTSDKAYKNIYMESLALYNCLNNPKAIVSSTIEELYKTIGYDKLESVCFKTGVRTIIYELMKYTNSDEVYKYMNLLEANNSPFYRYNNDSNNKIEEFNFSVSVCKSGILDDVEASVDCGFNAYDLFYIYRYNVKKCLEEQKDIFGDNSYFDYDDVSRLYEIIGKENMLRLYLNNDLDGLRESLKLYDVDEIMQRIDATDNNLKKFLTRLKTTENIRKHM